LAGREAPGTEVVEREAGREEARLLGMLPPPAMRYRKPQSGEPESKKLYAVEGGLFLGECELIRGTALNGFTLTLTLTLSKVRVNPHPDRVGSLCEKRVRVNWYGDLTPGRLKSPTEREGTGVVEREAGRDEARLWGVLLLPAMQEIK